MDKEKLIECVRAHSGLYDLSDRKYSDSAWKEKTWKIIGEELNQPASVCKTKWVNIRDQYRKIMNKTKTSSGQAAKKISKYKFQEQLSFLTPYFQERPTISSIDNEENRTEGEEEEEDDDDEYEDQSASQGLNESTGQTSLHVENLCNNKILKKKNNKTTTETASSTVMKYLLESKKNTQVKEKPDHVDAFLLSIGSTLKSFDPYFLNLAKSKIFNIVQDMEMQQIMRKQNSFPQNIASNYVHPIWNHNYPSTGSNMESHNYPSVGTDIVLEHSRDSTIAGPSTHNVGHNESY